jgi:hypothetical protein
MTTVVDLGKLRFYWAGDYSDLTEYELNDVIRYGGNVYVYISVVRTIGNVPTNTLYWALMVEGINFVGSWSPSVQYSIGDAVAYGSTVYVSLVDNFNKQPDLFPLIWSQFIEGIQYEGVYNPITTYQANDVVTYGPTAYIATQTTSGNLPTNTVFWDSFVQGISPQGVYSGVVAYVPGDIVAYGANLYVAKANSIGNLPTNTAYWDPFIEGFQYVGVYNPITTYLPNDVVTYGPTAYIATANSTGNLPTDTAYWDLFIPGFENRGAWATATLYYVNDIVQQGANSYACQIQNTSGTFATDLSDGKWTTFVYGLRQRGDWTTVTSYLPYDIVVYGGNTYSCVITNISSVFATDLAAGRWIIFNGGIRWRGGWLPTTQYLLNDVAINLESSYIATQDFVSGTNFSVEFAAGKWQFFAQGGANILPVITPGLEGYALTVAPNGIDTEWANISSVPLVTTFSANTALTAGTMTFGMETVTVTAGNVLTLPSGAYFFILNPDGFALFN